MSSYELLIRHASAWAEQRKRALDPGVLEAALELRSFHDDLPATAWPAGSITDLMVRRWPSHGPDGVDPEVLADSLDTFVRFLRATGRMASGSEDPRALAKEAHRAAPRMAEAVADPARHSPTKALLAFGREIGIDAEQVDDPAQLEAALNQIMTAWNELPDDERAARMPLTGLGAALPGRGGVVSPHDPAVSPAVLRRAAEQARQSPFVQACLRFVGWVGPGREVTSTRALRLAEARQAYAELELWRWTDRDRSLALSVDLRSGAATADSEGFPWRSARDALALERLWYPVESAGLVEVDRTTARVSGQSPRTDPEWVDLASDLVIGLFEVADSSEGVPSASPVVLLLSELVAEGTLSHERLRALWDEDPDNHYRLNGDTAVSEAFRERAAQLSLSRLDRALHFFADTGIWEDRDEVYRLTDLGNVFVHINDDELDLGLRDL